MPCVLADIHHWDLFHSFQLLFEKRLGWELYRPIGMDWLKEGYWQLSSEPIVNEGILSTRSGRCRELLSYYWQTRSSSWARNATEMLRVGPIQFAGNGICHIDDLSKSGVFQKGITLSSFGARHFDLIISSVPQHYESFEKLRQDLQPHAKHVLHFGPGNVEWPVPPWAKNLLVHTIPNELPTGIHLCEYNQEFNLETFKYIKPTNHERIRSYVHYPESEQAWRNLGLNWNFRFIGQTLGSLSSTIVETNELAQSISDSAFTWHYKPGGESWGHILHNSFACGRPVVINANDYRNKKGGALLSAGTYIDVQQNPIDLHTTLVRASQPEEHERMCEQAHARFTQVVDFAQDATKVREFLEHLS